MRTNRNGQKTHRKKKKYTWLGSLAFLPAAIVALGLFLTFLVRYTDPGILFFPALPGLAFPVLLLLGFGFGILYLLFLQKRCLLFFVLIALNYPNIASTIQGKGKPEPETRNWLSEDRFKLMTYNVRLFDFYGELRREKGLIKDQLTGFIQDQDADIVCLQEYYESKDRSFSVGDRMEKAGYRYATSPASNRKFYYGNIIYSKFPILKQGPVDDLTLFDVVYADLAVGKDTIRVYNIHLESNRFDKTDRLFYETLTTSPLAERNKYKDGAMRLFGKMKRATVSRSRQIEKIALHAEVSQAPSRILICGDMNDQPVSYTYGHVRKKGYSDAFVEAGEGFGKSYAGNYPSYRIDYLFFKGRLEPLYFDTWKVDYSDHRPLTAVFSRRPDKEGKQRQNMRQ